MTYQRGWTYGAYERSSHPIGNTLTPGITGSIRVFILDK